MAGPGDRIDFAGRERDAGSGGQFIIVTIDVGQVEGAVADQIERADRAEIERPCTFGQAGFGQGQVEAGVEAVIRWIWNYAQLVAEMVREIGDRIDRRRLRHDRNKGRGGEQGGANQATEMADAG